MEEIKIILPYPNEFSMNYLSEVLKDRPHTFLFLVGEEQKIYKKNITLDYNELASGKIIAVGAEVLKHIFRVSGVTKYNGTIQELYNKEIDKKIKVGVLVDPSIIQIYPHKELQVLTALRSILTNVETPAQQKNYVIASTPREVNEILAYLKKSDKLIIDLETSDLYPHKGEILLYVFSTKSHEGFVIPADLVNNHKEELNELFTTKHLIFHNLKFDYKWLKFNGYTLHTDIERLDDTMLMSYCINENESKGLKDLALKFTDLGDYERELEIEKKKICKALKLKVAEFSYDLLPEEVLGEYAVRDGDATAQLYEQFLSKIGRPEHYKLMLLYSLHLIDVELNGGYISQERLTALENYYKQKIEGLEQEMRNHLPEEVTEFNPRSPKQVASVLYDYLMFDVVKTTDAGAPSTDEEALTILSKTNPHPFITALLQYRKAFKFYTTYVLAIKDNLDKDGRIRTNFNITGTVSGRLSSSGTINFQNIPSKDKHIKKLFVPEKEGWYIYQQDLKTAEVWMAAYLSNDKFLQEVFSSGGDFHGHVAKRVFSLDCEANEVKDKYPELRQAAKAINYTGRL